MELYDMIKCMCTKNSSSIQDADKRKNSFILKRLYSAKYPIACFMLNDLSTDPIISVNILCEISKQFNNVPDFLNLKVSQKKKKSSIYKGFEGNIIDKCCELEQCSVNDLQLAYDMYEDDVKKHLKLVEETFFPKEEKIVKQKV